jgi:hypothetical protein
MEDNLQWDDLIDNEWHVWTGKKLREKWVALRNEVRVHTPNATHHGEYMVLSLDMPRS